MDAKLFDLIEIDLLSENERGSTRQLAEIPHKGMILAERKAGSISGNHWHEGNAAAKNPEQLLLLSGRMKISGKHLDSGEEQELEAEGPVLVKTYPRVLHTFKAISHCQFLEFNSIAEHEQDTYYPDSN